MKIYILYFVKNSKVHYYMKKDTYTYFKDYAKKFSGYSSAEIIAATYDLEIMEY